MNPILTRSEITDAVYIVTKYKILEDGLVRSTEKYDVTEQFKAMVKPLVDENKELREENDALNGFLSDVAERCGTKECPSLIDYVNQLRELVHDLLLLPSVPAFDCFGCRYEKHHDCECGLKCRLIERAKAFGIEVESESES